MVIGCTRLAQMQKIEIMGKCEVNSIYTEYFFVGKIEFLNKNNHNWKVYGFLSLIMIAQEKR